uniref:Serine aminopeptidase S33 domain-containing protein n=1 Tax=Aegilops tauschii TaxID=37682 RepID=M8BFR3_AEGTA
MTKLSSSNVDDGYEYEEEYINNARGMNLFTCRWLPANARPIKALVFMCHGYAVECSVTMRGTGVRLAQAGYAVYGMDYEGHGKSDGLRGYVPSFDVLLGDCDAYFTAVITEEMKPHPAVIKVLELVTRFIPTWKVVPTRNVIGAAYRTQAKRDEIRRNPYCYKGRPRLKTAHELLRASLRVESEVLTQVTLPFLVVHGGGDRVTDPSVSQLLCREAPSTDKTLKLYPGMWHALTSGELPENIDKVFIDIIAWLDHRSGPPATAPERDD